MAPYDAAVTADCFAQARNTFNYLIGQLTDPSAGTLTHDHLEELLVEQGRELQRLLLQAHLDLRARRERHALAQARRDGAGAVGADGVVRHRVETGHHRLLATVLGTVRVTRCAWRAPNVGNLYPADTALSLPDRRHSHGLARLAVTEAVRGSFDTAHTAITGRCGPVIGKRQIEDLIVASACDIDAFYAEQTPVPRTHEELLVLSFDGKGIAMRPEALRPATRKAAAQAKRAFRTRLAAGEKPARKRICATRHSVISPAEPGGTRREVPGSDGLPDLERVEGTIACQESSDRVQAYEAVRCGTRTIRLKLNCLNSNLQQVQCGTRRKGA